MATQYDPIAETYDRIIGDLPIRQMLEYTHRHVIGDVAGKSVLDLACGNGYYTRPFKVQGASRVVGVDLSPALIERARQHEQRDPLGIEYLVGDGRSLGSLGGFDVVASAFLLNFAPTREDLRDMGRAVLANLQGEHFVAINLNVQDGPRIFGNQAYKQYGVFYEHVAGSLDTSATIRMTVSLGTDQVQFDIVYLPPEDYEWALREAGFTSLTWHKPQLSPEFEQRYGRAFWQFFLDNPSIIILECRK